MENLNFISILQNHAKESQELLFGLRDERLFKPIRWSNDTIIDIGYIDKSTISLLNILCVGMSHDKSSLIQRDISRFEDNIRDEKNSLRRYLFSDEIILLNNKIHPLYDDSKLRDKYNLNRYSKIDYLKIKYIGSESSLNIEAYNVPNQIPFLLSYNTYDYKLSRSVNFNQNMDYDETYIATKNLIDGNISYGQSINDLYIPLNLDDYVLDWHVKNRHFLQNYNNHENKKTIFETFWGIIANKLK